MKITRLNAALLCGLSLISLASCGGDGESENTPMELKISAASDNVAKGGLEEFVRVVPGEYTLKKDTTDSVSQVEMEVELEALKAASIDIDSLVVTVIDDNNTPVNVKADFLIKAVNDEDEEEDVNITNVEAIAKKKGKCSLSLTSADKLTFDEWKEMLEKGKSVVISTSGAKEIILMRGSIGGHSIVLTLNKEGEKVKGEYWYGQKRGGIPLLLSGTWDNNGDFDINEVNVDGMPTGHFKGTLAADNSSVIEGTFTNFRNESFSFSIEKEPVE